MIKVGDKVEILKPNGSLLTVGSRHIITAVRGWKEHKCRVVSIGKWLFPTDYLKRVIKPSIKSKEG